MKPAATASQLSEIESTPWGEVAVVIGAGIAGLSAAAALSPHFARVVVLERDALPEGPEQRPSVPQGRHGHILLAGGLDALERLLPGFARELADAGAIRIEVDRDLRTERVPFAAMPARDCGFYSYALSRPLLEFTLRARVRALANVAIESGCVVQGLVAREDESAPRAVRYKRGRASPEELACDLVIDGSGRGEITLQFMRELGLAEPEETSLGVDLAYTTQAFEVPRERDASWKTLMTLAQAPLSSAGGLLLPVEGDRWLVSVGGRGAEKPPADADGFMAFVHGLRTPTLARALEHASSTGELACFAFPTSRRRHFERLAALPSRLLTLGDAACRFNPIYGQGMAVAARQALALSECLQRTAAGTDWSLLGNAVVQATTQITDAAWSMSAIPDLLYRQTVGTRPPDLRERLVRSAAVLRLAIEDPEVHRLSARIAHLLEPPSALQRPEIDERLRKVLERGL